jgi:hypothetical protein
LLAGLRKRDSGSESWQNKVDYLAINTAYWRWGFSEHEQRDPDGCSLDNPGLISPRFPNIGTIRNHGERGQVVAA